MKKKIILLLALLLIPTSLLFAAQLAYRYSGLANFSNIYSGNAGTYVGNKGKNMYIFVTGSTNVIYQYNLAVPWNISTSSLVYSGKSFSTSGNTPDRTVSFTSDGLHFYATKRATQLVLEYTLSTAWDISTASFTASFSPSAQEANVDGAWVSNDGTKMYVNGDSNNSVWQYTLATPYLVSTASYASKTFSFAGQTTDSRGLALSYDLTILAVSSEGFGSYLYSLSTPGDVSTATYSGTLVGNTQGSNGQPVFSDTAAKFYISDNSTMESAYEVPSISSINKGTGFINKARGFIFNN